MQDLKELNEVITAIKEEIRQGADALTTSKSVYEFKKTFLDNKQGRIGLLMKEMRNVANDQKAEFGKTINGAKEWANNFFDELNQRRLILRCRRLKSVTASCIQLRRSAIS